MKAKLSKQERDRLIESLVQCICEALRKDSELRYEAVLYGRVGLLDMSDKDLTAVAALWRIRGDK